MSYLDAKTALMTLYDAYLLCYLMKKLEGKEDISNQPFILKLARIRTILEKSKTLDSKLRYQIQKLL
jgi:hypothetical protein